MKRVRFALLKSWWLAFCCCWLYWCVVFIFIFNSYNEFMGRVYSLIFSFEKLNKFKKYNQLICIKTRITHRQHTNLLETRSRFFGLQMAFIKIQWMWEYMNYTKSGGEPYSGYPVLSNCMKIYLIMQQNSIFLGMY